MRKLWLVFAVVLVAVLIFFSLPRWIDPHMNSVASPAPYSASEAAQQLHQQLFIADLHDDALLWQRDLLKRHDYGHADVPRLIEGNVGLQVFSTVTKTPRGLNYDSNDANSDTTTLLIMAQRWPTSTWFNLLNRALYQAERLDHAAAASQGKLSIIRNRGDLEGYLERRASNTQQVAGLLATEGLHPLQGRLDNVDVLYDAGFRIAGLVHFFDNEVGGSAHGVEKTGLTEFGRQVIPRLEQRGILVDLAHASPRLIDEVLAIAQKPVLVSHTGVAGTCPGPRNLTDDQLQGVAATGGLIGIGYWDAAVCETSAAAIAKAIRYSADQIGVEHIALGSDFDGAVHTPFDTTGLVQITAALIEEGFNDQEISAIMGTNLRDLLLRHLPE